jgi:hypothetical protein
MSVYRPHVPQDGFNGIGVECKIIRGYSNWDFENSNNETIAGYGLRRRFEFSNGTQTGAWENC